MTGTGSAISSWCQQLQPLDRHALLFGRDGNCTRWRRWRSFSNVDYGQYGANCSGDQANPCGDPPGAAGTALSPPGGGRAARCA